MNVDPVATTVSVMDAQYMAGTPQGISHFREEHRLGLFTHKEYAAAFKQSDLDVEYDKAGLMGR